jgi:hypothetical protein
MLKIGGKIIIYVVCKGVEKMTGTGPLAPVSGPKNRRNSMSAYKFMSYPAALDKGSLGWGPADSMRRKWTSAKLKLS